jgi:outer membrane protein OmpA-like peptidoglycan-associated protein
MIKAFVLIFSFISLSVLAQTYEIIEVEIECSPKKIPDLNSDGSDFSPYVSGENFYFTSSREYDKFNLGENNWKRSGYLNIFKGKIKGDLSPEMKVKNIEIISNKLMTDNHTGPLCVSISGDTMFFTQVKQVSKKNRKKKEKYRPQLYMSVKKGKVWQTAVALPFNDEKYSFGHPTYDSKNQRLYFASDMLGGKGGKDIYYSDLKNNAWSLPTNFGKVNTSAHEVFPCIVNDYIFYSSDRAGGEGGLDVYWQNVGETEKKAAEVIGLNSPEDDFGLYVTPGMNKGFYSNNSSGQDDIMYFDMEKKVTVKNALAGRFTYRNIQGTASGLSIVILDENDQIILETKTDEDGEFVFNNIAYEGDYRIEAKTEDELYLTIFDKDGNPITKLVSDENGAFSYKKLGYDKGGTLGLIPEDMLDVSLNQGHLSGQFIYENFPGKYPNELKVMLIDEGGNMKFQTFTDENGNFDFRQLDMEENYILSVPEKDGELILLIFDKKGNVVAQLKSDQEGGFTYRKLKPSYANSLSVMEETDEMFELETKTISGYFEYKNIETTFEKGLKVQAYTEDGILIEEVYTDKNGKFRFRSLPIEDNLLFKVDEQDQDLELDDFTLYIFDRNGKKIAQLRRGQNDFFIYKPLGFDTSNHLTQIGEDSLDINISIKTEYDLVVVYFDSNKSNVKGNDVSKLSKMYKLLKDNPQLKIEVNAYADAKNSDEYNLILSGDRGDWIVKYFIKKGLPKNRFIVNAYGEAQLVDETNDALNRRAEIRIYE